MTKKEFIDELCRKLRLMPPDEAQRTVIFYSEAIDDRIEDGMTEEEAVAAVGDIDDIVREVMGTVPPRAEDTARNDSGDWSGPPTEKEYTFSPDGVKAITAGETDGDVRLSDSSDGLIHVRCTEGNGVHYRIETGETLRITKIIDSGLSKKVNRKLNMFGISLDLNLPNISFGGGSDTDLEVLIPPISGLVVNANTSSGDIDCDLGEVYSMHLRSGSGDIDVSGLRVADVLEATSASGDCDISNVICDRLILSCVSGDSEAEGVTAREVRVNTVSGDANVSEAYISERLSAVSVSGDVGCRLLAVLPHGSFESVSGDIEVRLFGKPEDYNSFSRTNGGMSIKSGYGGPNEIRAKSVSGYISVEVEG